MSRLIADIFGAETVKFNHLIESWERRSGSHGHDLRLYSDMRAKALSAVKEIGLDPSDTATGELYFALQERAKYDNEWLENYIGVEAKDSPQQALEKILSWINENSNTKVWVCKHSLIRGYLKKQPPKNLMKVLGLRSVDSMLKRNNPVEILTLAREIESNEWVKKFQLQFKNSKPSDFDESSIDFLVMPSERIARLKKADYPLNRVVSPSFELGSLVISTPQYRFPLDVLAITLALASTISDIRKYSSYYRALSVRSDFGQQIYEVSLKGIVKASSEISEIGWNSIHRHLAGNEYFLSKIEQPYLTKDDFVTESALDFLSSHDRRFIYWRDLEYAFYHHKTSQPVSLNLIDVVTNATNRVPLSQASTSHGQTKLWEELWARYLKDESIAEDVINQFTNNGVS